MRATRHSPGPIATIIAALIAALLPATAAAAQPNIVYILADDLGVGDLSCYGQTNWSTPRLDRMAAEGMRFTRAYSGSTVCAPSRAALLTGQHTGRVFMRGNGRIALRPDPLDLTIATRLRDAGYATAMIGKSSVACLSSDPTLPNAKGFDHFFGALDHAEAHRNYPRRLVRNGEWVTLPGNNGKTGDTFANGLYVDEAVTWLGGRDERPFFLLLSLTVPHADLSAPERHVAPFRGRFPETPHTTSGYLHQTEPRAAYAGMVAFLDEAVGRILDELHARGLDERTLVIFASDNGTHAEGGADPEAFDSNGPLRGWKRALHEGGIRTPQIAWWPGTIPPGAVTDHITAMWDFAPTALELAGLDIPRREMQGISIAPLLTGRPADQTAHRYLYWEFHEQGGRQAVRSGRWKAIRQNADRDPDGPLELYDLDADPGETDDIAADHPDVVRLMARYMAHAHRPSPEYHFGTPARSISREPAARRIANERDRLVLDRAAFRVIRATSEAPDDGMAAANVLSDDLDARWHTRWRDGQPPHPHAITIDLGRPLLVRGLRLMARQDATDHGTIRRAEFAVTAEDKPDPAPHHTHTLRFTKDEQEVLFDRPARGRYLTITSRSAFGGSPFASLANVEVLGEE